MNSTVPPDATTVILDFWAEITDFCLPSVCLILKLIILIFFIHNFTKKISPLHNKYFYLLFVGFAFDVVTSISQISYKICYFCNGDCFIAYRVYTFLKLHHCEFSSARTFALTLNRFTSVAWFTKHEQIWSKHFKAIIFLLFMYPFFITGYMFINYKCRFYLDGCENYEEYWREDSNVTALANGIVAILSFFVALFTAFIYRRKKVSKSQSSAKTKAELRLILHAAITSFSYDFHLFLYSYSWYLGIDDSQLAIVNFMLNTTYDIYHISPYILLLIFSEMVRNEVSNFIVFHGY